MLTFDVVSEDGSVVVLPGGDLEGGGGVRLSALISSDHFNLSGVDVATLGNVKVPHAVVDQLVFAALKKVNNILCKV